MRYSPNCRYFVAFQAWEGLGRFGSIEDPLQIIPVQLVQVGVDGIQLALQAVSALFVPDEGRTVVAQVLGEGLQVPGSVGQF